MTDHPQYRFEVTTSDGKYTVREDGDGRLIVLGYGDRSGAQGDAVLSPLEFALARDLADMRAELDRLLKAPASGLPIDLASKDGRMLRLLVRYDRDNDGHHGPLDDEAWNAPAWTIGFNTLGDTGEDEWHIAGWNWSHDFLTEGCGEPIGWLPFHEPALHCKTGQFLADVVMERHRQVVAEGWSADHDDEHELGEMARAAAAYAIHASWPEYGGASAQFSGFALWPWDREWWKPTDRRRDLVKAAALLIAEGERLDRKGGPVDNPCPVCARPLIRGEICAVDIELGICHAACLEGSPTVDLDTGEPTDGKIATFPYEPDGAAEGPEANG